QAEAEAVGLSRDGDGERARRVPERVGPHHEVGTAGGADADTGRGLPGPHPGGVDHLTCGESELLAVAAAFAPTRLVAHGDLRAAGLRDPGAGEDAGAVAGGGPGDAHDQPGVVDQLAVPVEMAEAQPVAPDPGHVLG